MENQPNHAETFRDWLRRGVLAAAWVAVLFTVLLVAKSLLDFTRTGPAIQEEIVSHFAGYAALHVARLAGWTFLLAFIMASIGVSLYAMIASILGWRMRMFLAILTAGAGIALLTVHQFVQHLLYIPGSIVASFQYRISRLYPLWEMLDPVHLEVIQWSLLIAFAAVFICYLKVLWGRSYRMRVLGLAGTAVGGAIVFLGVVLPSESDAVIGAGKSRKGPPNILLIGSDTLRADRLGVANYYRSLTPFIDNLSKRGTGFTNCFVPLARTAPSMASILTGTFPHTHGIRDNYVADDAVQLPVKALPQILSEVGYRTAAVGDWAAADLKKLSFGFQETEVAPDQWNLKYLIRQGPKDIRLFLSLFTHNRFGKIFLPELYYLAGVPMGSEVGRQARTMITRFAQQDAPFFLTVFSSHTHIPFSSEYPYYSLFSRPGYNGESRFAMSGLNDPAEIIKKQQQSAVEFDVKQMKDLYDGAVKSFDDEVRKIVEHLEKNGLRQNTIIVIFSDHGVDLFEKHTWGQGNTLLGDDPSTRIPLVIVDPRNSESRVENRVVRSVDLMPTLLELIGVEIPAVVEGASLVPYLAGQEKNMGLKAFSETGLWLAMLPGIKDEHLKYPTLLEMLQVPNKATGTMAISKAHTNRVIAAKDRMVRDEKWKLIYMPMKDDAVYMLFDMEKDPNGQRDVSQKHPEIFSKLKTSLVQWMNRDPARKLKNGHMLPVAQK